jgi:trigger factor
MWEVLAVTCELPTFDLPDYKTIAKNALAVSALWTPEKGDAKDATKEPTREEKENKILTTLLDSIKVVLPHMLIDEEVNARLSSLLQRIEKLGLTLEGYLSSIGKTVENLREDYHRQAEDSLKIELLLTRIADEEKIHITDEQIDQAVQVSAAGDPAVSSRLNEPDQRRIIGSILRKRAVLDSLLALG